MFSGLFVSNNSLINMSKHPLSYDHQTQRCSPNDHKVFDGKTVNYKCLFV